MGLYQELAELEFKGGRGALCIIISSQGSTPRHGGSKMLVYPDGHFNGSVGGGELEHRVIQEALKSITDGKPRRMTYSMVDPKKGDPGICGGTVEVYIEPISPKPEVLIIGGGHVGKAVAHLAKWLGFKVIISDDRSEFCSPEANPDGDAFYVTKMSALPTVCDITPQTYVILTTRGSAIDTEGLPALLDTPAAYIGVIGSKKRWLTTRNALVEMGVADDKIRRVQSPVGLDLQAETPEEIALSILSEIVMLRNQGTGARMTI